MRKFYLIIVLLTGLSSGSIAQKKKTFLNKFEIGGEGGLTLDYLTVRDPAGNMERGRGLISGGGGPKIRTYINQGLFIEAAFLWKENTFGFRFKQQRSYGNWSTNSSKIFMVPLRLGYELNLSRKLSLNATAGIVPTFIAQHYGMWGIGSTSPENITYSYQLRNEHKKTYVAIQPGISLDHFIKQRIRFSVGVNYYHGLSDAEFYDITYSINNGPIHNAVIANRGSFINYNAGLTYGFTLKKKK